MELSTALTYAAIVFVAVTLAIVMGDKVIEKQRVSRLSTPQ